MNPVMIDLPMKIENIAGILSYLVGLGGSYFRFSAYERKSKVDLLFLICLTWGYCSLMVSMLNIMKYTLIPSLHLEIARAIYYLGAALSSLVFFAKTYESAVIKTRIAAFTLMGGMGFIFIEGAIFYLDLRWDAAIASSIGLLVLYWVNLGDKRPLIGTLSGLVLLLLPIVTKLMKEGLDGEKMAMKRELAIRDLIQSQNGADNQEIAQINGHESSEKVGFNAEILE